jgi:hypothetical protein
MSFKVKGLDQVLKKLDYMKTDAFLYEQLKQLIIEKVPSARSEAHKFRFRKNSRGNIELDPNSVSSELNEKIFKALKK